MFASHNPFAILQASTRDRKARLNELADEAALLGDHDAAIHARNVLSNPRTRLAAEVGWFPGLSPKRIAATLNQISQGHVPALDGFNPLSCANFLVQTLGSRFAEGPEELREALEALAAHVEDIDADSVLQVINEDRQAAGLPLMADSSLVEAELNERIRHYERAATALLEDLPSATMVAVYEALVSDSTDEGETAGYRLINAVVDSYELKASGFLADEATRIKSLLEEVQAAADAHAPVARVRASIRNIIEALRAWDRVAQPVQLAYKSRGLDHGDSKDLASEVLSLAIHLNNEHDYFDEAKILGEALQELFSEVVALSERVDENVETFSGNVAHRFEAQREDARSKAEFERAISYETEFGLIFRDKFRISAAGFDYKGSLIPLEQVSGVRWGGVRRYRNGIYTGTDFYFCYGTATTTVLLQPKEHQYQAIVQRAWRAVCVRILLSWIDHWRKGGTINVAGVTVSDDGLVLRRSRLFKDDETRFFSWFDVTKGSHNGNLNFVGKSDKKFSAQFSFKDGWNVHILDFAVDKIWEGKASKLSKIFES